MKINDKDISFMVKWRALRGDGVMFWEAIKYNERLETFRVPDCVRMNVVSYEDFQCKI